MRANTKAKTYNSFQFFASLCEPLKIFVTIRTNKMQTKIVPFIEWTRTFHFADKFLSFIQKLLFPISSSYLSITAVCFLVLVVEFLVVDFSILYGPTDVYSVDFIVKKTSSGKNRPSSFLTLSASAAYPIPYSRWPTNKCNETTFLFWLAHFLSTSNFWKQKVSIVEKGEWKQPAKL